MKVLKLGRKEPKLIIHILYFGKKTDKRSFLTIGGTFEYVIITVMSCKIVTYYLARFAWSGKTLARHIGLQGTFKNNVFCKKNLQDECKIQISSKLGLSIYDRTGTSKVGAISKAHKAQSF